MDHPFCFSTCFAVVLREKIGPNGVHSRMQCMKWNDGLFPVAHQHGEARQSYWRTPVGWPQPFPRRFAPKCPKIALKMGILSANWKKWRFCSFSRSLTKCSPSELVVWDSKLLKHGNWGELGPF